MGFAPTYLVVRPMKKITYVLVAVISFIIISIITLIWISSTNVKVLENHLGIKLHLTGFEIRGIRDQYFVFVYQTDPATNSVFLWAIYPWRSNYYTTEKFHNYN